MTNTGSGAKAMPARYRISADIGGTFTDIVVHDTAGNRYLAAKAPTTPGALSDGILAAFDQVLPDFSEVEFAVHGTTQGLNALLSRSGDRVLLLTTRGARDSYYIMRGSRPREEMYNNKFQRPDPLVPRRDTLEIGGRLDFAGEEIAPLSRADLEAAAAYARANGISSIAICFLFSYQNPRHEIEAGDVLRELIPGVSLSLSHQVAREWREAERTASTVADAYISRIVREYLGSIEQRFAGRKLAKPLYVMRSSGGVMTVTQAATQPIQTLFSGPVGGTIGSAAVAKLGGRSHVICADVGGTSFDVSLVIDAQPRVANQTSISGMDLILPLVEIYSIGAGGGSLAYIEAGGLRVGPKSAGAVPGPACYGKGGAEPTVTDAQVFLKRFLPADVVGGTLRIDREKAEAALTDLARSLSMDTVSLAEGIIEITNAKMAEAIRKITVEQGIEPRDFSIVAFGGAGPMHAAFLAQALEVREVIIPPLSGVFSAWGMLHAPIRHDISVPFYRVLGSLDPCELTSVFAETEEEARTLIREEAGGDAEIIYQRQLDLRYDGQEYPLTVDISNIGSSVAGIAGLFHAAYRQRYGHAHEDSGIEIVAIRLVASAAVAEAAFEDEEQSAGEPSFSEREVVFGGKWLTTRIYDASTLRRGNVIAGPAIVDGDTATTVVPPGATLHAEGWGLLRMTFSC